MVVGNLPYDGVTIFGKSQPDVVIYKSRIGYIKGRGIVGADGVALELKKSVVNVKARSPELAQSCANLVRVSGFLSEKALEQGCVVEEINIYGLLVSHSSPYCVPLRYQVEVNEESWIMKGDEMRFDEALESIITHLT